MGELIPEKPTGSHLDPVVRAQMQAAFDRGIILSEWFTPEEIRAFRSQSDAISFAAPLFKPFAGHPREVPFHEKRGDDNAA